MNPATINTILNSAPMILQGAHKLIRMIRERDAETPTRDAGIPATLEGLRQELDQVQDRLDANDESDVEQIQLIEQLAKQNEAMAESLRRVYRRITLLTFLAAVAVAAAVVTLLAILVP